MPNELILIVENNPKNLKLVLDTLQVKEYHTIETEVAIPLYVAVAGFLAVLVYSTTAPGPVDDGQRGSALVCQYVVERNGQAIGSCQERR